MRWELSHRFDRRALPLADRHYNRQKPGTPQFVPPGSCVVLLTSDESALWVTSWPIAEFTKHEWAGAWVNSTFRNEGRALSSELIRDAVAVTLWRYGSPPPLGMVTFIDPRHVPGFFRRTSSGRFLEWGYSYWQAGFEHVGWTKDRQLYAMQLLPDRMPAPAKPHSQQFTIDFNAA